MNKRAHCEKITFQHLFIPALASPGMQCGAYLPNWTWLRYTPSFGQWDTNGCDASEAYHVHQLTPSRDHYKMRFLLTSVVPLSWSLNEIPRGNWTPFVTKLSWIHSLKRLLWLNLIFTAEANLLTEVTDTWRKNKHLLWYVAAILWLFLTQRNLADMPCLSTV